MKDGGPAFPVLFQHDHGNGALKSREWDGMTLRDYFAAAALGGMCANPQYDDATLDTQTKDAYRLADAMLVEREKEK